MTDEEAYEFYEDPEHLIPAGPARAVRSRGPLLRLSYTPAECGPQAVTVNTGSLPRIIKLEEGRWP